MKNIIRERRMRLTDLEDGPRIDNKSCGMFDITEWKKENLVAQKLIGYKQ